MFERLLGPLLPDARFATYRVYDGVYPAALTDCEAYIISGSRSSVYDPEPWILRLTAYVRAIYAAERRMIGVCFGHQLLAHALGGRTERAVQGWGVGRHRNEILAAADWMDPAPGEFALYFSHRDQVTALPPGSRLLARNGHCPHAMFELGGRCLGIQGHPEFTAAFARDLLLAKDPPPPAPVIEAALPTYEAPVDAELVAAWMAGFLRTAGR